jgi:hypothetical protein
MATVIVGLVLDIQASVKDPFLLTHGHNGLAQTYLVAHLTAHLQMLLTRIHQMIHGKEMLNLLMWTLRKFTSTFP